MPSTPISPVRSASMRSYLPQAKLSLRRDRRRSCGGAFEGLAGAALQRHHILLDRRAGEEVRIGTAMQAHEIGEGEVAEIPLAEQPVLDALIGFGDDILHLGHVPMA